MRWFRIIIILIVAVLLQATIVPALAVRGVRPDLPLLAALCLVAREAPDRRFDWSSFWVGWVAGLLVDVYSPGSLLPFGFRALVFGTVAVGLNRVAAELFVESVIAQIIVIGPFCVGVHLVLAVGVMVFAGTSPGVSLRGALGVAAYSTLVVPLVFAVLRPICRLLGLQTKRRYGGV